MHFWLGILNTRLQNTGWQGQLTICVYKLLFFLYKKFADGAAIFRSHCLLTINFAHISSIDPRIRMSVLIWYPPLATVNLWPSRRATEQQAAVTLIDCLCTTTAIDRQRNRQVYWTLWASGQGKRPRVCPLGSVAFHGIMLYSLALAPWPRRAPKRRQNVVSQHYTYLYTHSEHCNAACLSRGCPSFSLRAYPAYFPERAGLPDVLMAV